MAAVEAGRPILSANAQAVKIRGMSKKRLLLVSGGSTDDMRPDWLTFVLTARPGQGLFDARFNVAFRLPTHGRQLA